MTRRADEAVAGATRTCEELPDVFVHPVNRASPNGVSDTPSEATAAAGEKLAGSMVEDLTIPLRRGIGEMPALPHGSDQRAHARTPR